MTMPTTGAFNGYARQTMLRYTTVQTDAALQAEKVLQEKKEQLLEESRAREDAELRETEQKEAEEQELAASAENPPATEQEKEKMKMERAGVADKVLRRLQLAWVAMTLGLPDHAVYMIRYAYSDVRDSLRSFLWELKGKKPNKEQQKTIDMLRYLQDMVLSRMRGALASHGGPELSPQEVEALLIEDRDVEPEGLDPAATQILQSFNLNKTKASVKKNAFSGIEKIVKKLPEMLMSVAEALQTLRDDPDAGAGSAQMFVNAALSKLELSKGLLSMLSGTENAFKAMAVQSLKLELFQEQVEQLSGMAEGVYLELEERGFVRGRSQALSELPSIEELETMAKDPGILQRKLNEKHQKQGAASTQERTDTKPITPAPLMKRSTEAHSDAGPFVHGLSMTAFSMRG